MRSLLSTFLVLTLPLAAAADEGQPNTLTSKEIAEGWLLLFDGESTYGWRSPNGSQWTVFEGMLSPQASKPGRLVTTTAFLDYELRFEYQLKRGSKVQVLTACTGKDEALKESYAAFTLIDQGPGWTEAHLQVEGGAVATHRFTRPGAKSFARKTIPPSKPKPAAKGYIGLSGNGVVFRSIKLRPLRMKSIFNGIDLKGWKEFPGKKSKFNVTRQGWLEIKNGPGDLQSEGQWDDFVVQLQCRSNGKHLNSGVFFRCRPGEYQQGYEAQIRNQFTKALRPYTIEEYDPKTHEVKGKTTVRSPAVDYGTGGIYRRMPARRGVARDGEWFTMTVVADGRHFATWINGVQVTDWTDNRPMSDNARKGCRLEKGPISFQGHDPTTDLSFRNIRIAGLRVEKPAEK